jgi:hypothetical protein
MIAAVSGTAVAASAAVWMIVAPQAGTTPAGGQAGAPASAESTEGEPPEPRTTVCVGGDGILRASLPEGGCPPGHRPMRLPKEEDCEMCPPFEEPTPQDPVTNRELALLERRIRALETSAYFEVVDDDDRPVFSIGPEGVRVFNRSGVPVVAFGRTDFGGYVTARSTTMALEAALGATGRTAGLQIREDGLTRLEVSAKPDGGAALRLPSGDGGLIAGLGSSVEGPGALLLGTRDGWVKATLTAPGGRGRVNVRRTEKSGGLVLQEAGIGGGMLLLGDAKDDRAVLMGHVKNSYGLVMAGPVPGLPLVPKTGLPGSYFMGCGSEAPPACMPVID